MQHTTFRKILPSSLTPGFYMSLLARADPCPYADFIVCADTKFADCSSWEKRINEGEDFFSPEECMEKKR